MKTLVRSGQSALLVCVFSRSCPPRRLSRVPRVSCYVLLCAAVALGGGPTARVRLDVAYAQNPIVFCAFVNRGLQRRCRPADVGAGVAFLREGQRFSSGGSYCFTPKKNFNPPTDPSSHLSSFSLSTAPPFLPQSISPPYPRISSPLPAAAQARALRDECRSFSRRVKGCVVPVRSMSMVKFEVRSEFWSTFCTRIFCFFFEK